MKPLSLRARSFRTFETLDVDLPTGAVAVLGDNGAGKSSLVMLSDLCLFGPESRSLAPYQSEDALEDLMIELTFEHGGALYRVRRGYCANGRGKASADFEVAMHNTEGKVAAWTPRTCETIKATDEAISRTIGMTRETFRASAYLAQGDGSFADPSWDPRQRKELLFCSLGLDQTWGPLAELARRDKRSTEDALRTLAGKVESAEQIAAESAAAHERAANVGIKAGLMDRAVEEADRRLAALRSQIAEAEQAESKRNALRSKLEAAEANWKRFEEADARAVEARQKLEAIRPRLTEQESLAAKAPEIASAIADAEREREELAGSLRLAEEAVRERDERKRAIEQREAEVVSLGAKASAAEHAAGRVGEGEITTCDRCGEPLVKASALEHTRQSYLSEAKDARATIAKLDDENRRDKALVSDAATVDASLDAQRKRDQAIVETLARFRNDLSEAKIAAAQVVSMRETIATYEAQVAKVEALEYIADKADADVDVKEAKLALAELSSAPDDLAALRRDHERADTDLVTARSEAKNAHAEVVKAEEALKRIEEAEAAIKALSDEGLNLERELNLLTQLERAYGRDGIPTLIVENSAIPAIEEEANHILQALNTSYRVELRTQRELKSGDGVADTLDVVILTDLGERPYESFSGGERSRINVALRIGLARLLARRRGASSRALLLDEIEYLDDEGLGALAEILIDLQAQGEFETILTVSHASALRDAFDRVIEIRKDGNRSEVVT